MRRLAAGLILTIGAVAWQAGPALAHPLGNYTTNLHLGIEVTPESVLVNLVVDMAEIPAFREVAAIGDGTPTEPELAEYAQSACASAVDSVDISADGTSLSLAVDSAGASLPAGEGGLNTLRLDCRYLIESVVRPSVLVVQNDLYTRRTGWFEIVARGSDVSLEADVPDSSPSGTLTTYPDGDPLDVRTARVVVGDTAAAFSPTPSGGDPVAADGGIMTRLSRAAADATAPIALLAAAGLGAAHAIAPGHGKTLMAAFLVGRGGGPRQAVGLALSVAIAHTIGVAFLGVITLLAANTFAPERLYPWLSGLSAAVITIIGIGMLARAFARRGHRHSHNEAGEGHRHRGQSHDHHHEHRAHGHDHHGHSHDHDAERPARGWRAMAGLGLAGGIVPSASAVILLLAGVGAGRPAFGLLMVGFFGLGMSVVLLSTGLAVVGVYRLGGRMAQGWGGLQRLIRLTQVTAAMAVTVIGLYLLVDVSRSI